MERDEVLKGIRKQLRRIGLEKMKERVAKKFYDMDDVVEALYRAFVSGKNVILYGPGGFGKSTVVVEFLKAANINYSTIVGYEDMDVEGLLGIPNMDKLLTKSIYETAFDRTAFVNPGILILEEFLDVNPKTAIALKDILTEGGLRQGNRFTESLISSVVICSNKSPYELSTDSSTTAFYKERFPVVVRVEWDKYNYNRYKAFIEVIVTPKEMSTYKEQIYVVAKLAASTTKKTSVPVSPRIVKDAIEFLRSNDWDIYSLRFIDGLDSDIIEEVREEYEEEKEREKIKDIKDKVNKAINEIMEKEPKSVMFIIESIKEITAIKDYLISIKIDDPDNIDIVADIVDTCETSVGILWSLIKPEEEILSKIEEMLK